MKTYLLEGDRKKLEPLKARSTFFLMKRRRAVAVLERPPAKELIAKELDGDQGALLAAWAERNALDDLHLEYLSQAPIQPHKQEAAIERYRAAVKRRAKADAAAERALVLEREACKNLIRHFGRMPIVIDGETHDPCYAGETVFFVKRSLPKAGVS